MSKTFFTADTHFGHARIIELCNRPFTSVEEMDEALIARWNAVVSKNDHVWHLGDFTLSTSYVAEVYRKQLNGKISLVYGNHDRPAVRGHEMWSEIARYGDEIKVDGWHLTLCHYAFRVWNGSHRKDGNSLMLYGHSHGMQPAIHRSLDVGVDCWNFTPVTLPEITDRLRDLDLL